MNLYWLFMQAFMDNVHAYYSDVPKEIINLMWSRSYDDNHSYGYDETFNDMDEYYEFYLEIKKCLT